MIMNMKTMAQTKKDEVKCYVAFTALQEKDD